MYGLLFLLFHKKSKINKFGIEFVIRRCNRISHLLRSGMRKRWILVPLPLNCSFLLLAIPPTNAEAADLVDRFRITGYDVDATEQEERSRSLIVYCPRFSLLLTHISSLTALPVLDDAHENCGECGLLRSCP